MIWKGNSEWTFKFDHISARNIISSIRKFGETIFKKLVVGDLKKLVLNHSLLIDFFSININKL